MRLAGNFDDVSEPSDIGTPQSLKVCGVPKEQHLLGMGHKGRDSLYRVQLVGDVCLVDAAAITPKAFAAQHMP